MIGTIKSLITLLAYLITGAITLAIAVPVSLLFIPFGRQKKVFSAFVYRYMNWAIFHAIKFLRVLEITEIKGLENIQKNVIVVANHQSFLDGFMIMGNVPSIPLIKSSYKFNPLFLWISLLFDFVGIEYSPNGIIKADKKIRDLLAKGESICILPEGTRSLDGKIKKFQTLAFRIAKETKKPLLPVVIHYDRPIMSKSLKTFIFAQKVNAKIEILPVISPQENETTATLLKRTQEAVEVAYAKLSI